MCICAFLLPPLGIADIRGRPRLGGDGFGMPQLPRDIGEQIAGDRSTTRRVLDFLRRLLGLKAPPPPGRKSIARLRGDRV